jgi:hypothetical protein
MRVWAKTHSAPVAILIDRNIRPARLVFDERFSERRNDRAMGRNFALQNHELLQYISEFY